MNAVINYFVEVNIGLTLFYTVYYFLFKKETDFRSARVYLMGSMVFSLLFPLLSIAPGDGSTSIIPSVSYYLPELVIGYSPDVTVSTISKQTSAFSPFNGWAGLYASVTLIFLVHFCWQLIALIRFVRRAPAKWYQGSKLIETKNSVPSFSFFNWVVVGNVHQLDAHEKEQIIKHELVHVHRAHTADLIVAHLVRCFFWLNPISWSYKSALEEVHEFEADSETISPDTLFPYCRLLAKVALANEGFQIVHHFNKSLTLKRIEMMKMIKKQISHWKIALSIATAAACFVFVACQDQLVSELNKSTVSQVSNYPPHVIADMEKMKEKFPGEGKFSYVEGEENEVRSFLEKLPNPQMILNTYMYKDRGVIGVLTRDLSGISTTTDSREIFTVVEETAEPLEGIHKFYEHLAMQIKYPLEARQQKITGRVFVEFVVLQDGNLADFKVVKGIGGGCDEEALRVIASAPMKWKPGKQRGVAVNQRMVLPITFALDNGVNSGTIAIDPLNPSNKTMKVVMNSNSNQALAGVVTDEQGNAIQGMNIVIEGTTTGTVTDQNGKFNLSAPVNSGSLVFSFVGYKTEKIAF
jgi:TonB family protein